jgi:hypothetical protein
LCKKGGFSVLSPNAEREKSRVGKNDSHFVFSQEYAGEKVVWDGALSWWNIQIFCRESSARSPRIFSHSRRERTQYYAELIVWPARTNSLWTVLCCQRKWCACSWLRSSSVSPFTVSVSLDFLSTAHAFLPERLSDHFQSVRCAFSNIWITYDAVPLSDPSQNRIRTDTRLQIERRKKSAPPSCCVKFCALTPKIC